MATVCTRSHLRFARVLRDSLYRQHPTVKLFVLVTDAAAGEELALAPAVTVSPLSLPLSEPQGLGFAVGKGSPLAGELSAHLERLKESGIYFRLLERYLGSDAAALVTASHR